MEIRAAGESLIAAVRSAGGPRALVIDTYRLAPHSKGDDFRVPAEIDHFRERDPISLVRRQLSEEEWQDAADAARREVEEAYRQAESDPWPLPDSFLKAHIN
jgi:TPP-dependent pyruvate/acetoin dehydrogenase alpha subunit